jgi:hypothetical protein
MNNGGRGLCILARPVRCVSYRRRAPRARSPLLFCALFLVPLLGASCSRMGGKPPSIEFTSVPPADRGGPDFMDTIAGRVKGAKPEQKIVIFTHNNVWCSPGRASHTHRSNRIQPGAPQLTWEWSTRPFSSTPATILRRPWMCCPR